MKNIHILLTDKPSRLFKNIHTKLLSIRKYDDKPLNEAIQNQNIYITNDEEIKEGDSVVLKSGRLTKAETLDGILGFQTIDGIAFLYFQEGDKKIILTTDHELIADGVQAIDDEFLEWFVKNPSCEKVDIIPLRKSSGYYDEKEIWHWDFLSYHIVIPKEEGCSVCKGKKEIEVLVMGTDTEFVECYNCNQKLTKEEPKQETFENHYLSTLNPLVDISRMKLDNHPDLHKQETLEEVAEKIADNFEEPNFKAGVIYGVIEGAKWQAERMYSEEDLKYAFDSGRARLTFDNKRPFVFQDYTEWKKQFKKK